MNLLMQEKNYSLVKEQTLQVKFILLFDIYLYFINFDIFLHNEVGYEKIKNLDQGMFLNSYSITSLSEYFATSFEEYYLRNRRLVKKVTPAAYTKIDLIHRGDIEYDH